MQVPAYTGTIALIIGMVVSVLGIVGVKLPEDFTGQATQLVTAVISVISMGIGVWRLLHTKKIADTATAQVAVTGQAPLVGSNAGVVPSESDKLNAQQVIDHARKAAQS